MGQPGVDALGDDAVAVDEIVGLVVVEARIGAEKFGEIVKAALELGGRDDFVHLGANALYFREADFVNLLRREIRGGLPADVEAVSGGAVGQRGGSDVFAASGQIRRRDIVVEFVERGRNRRRVD